MLDKRSMMKASLQPGLGLFNQDFLQDFTMFYFMNMWLEYGKEPQRQEPTDEESRINNDWLSWFSLTTRNRMSKASHGAPSLLAGSVARSLAWVLAQTPRCGCSSAGLCNHNYSVERKWQLLSQARWRPHRARRGLLVDSLKREKFAFFFLTKQMVTA